MEQAMESPHALDGRNCRALVGKALFSRAAICLRHLEMEPTSCVLGYAMGANYNSFVYGGSRFVPGMNTVHSTIILNARSHGATSLHTGCYSHWVIVLHLRREPIPYIPYIC